jgi:hypothetical protein
MAYCCGYEYYNTGHMNEECISTEGEYFCLPVNLLSEFEKEDKVKEMDKKDDVECCICWETIGEKNNCVTECGHRFCFGCMLKAMTYNTACPYCRKELLEDNPVDEEVDEEAEEEEVEEEEADDEEAEEEHGHIEDIVQRMESRGITMLDLASVLFNKYSKRDAKYTPEYIDRLESTLDHIVEDVETEARENRDMGDEDRHRTDTNTVTGR